MFVRNQKKRLLAFAFCCLLFLPCLAARAQSTPTTTKLTAPVLEIPIPNLSLSDAVAQNGQITIPFLGQYISGIYSFAVSIAGLCAAVMMIIGGFQYLTSAGDKGRIGTAKKRITNALIGLVSRSVRM